MSVDTYNLKGQVRVGNYVLLGLCGTIAVWSTFAQISGAVVANGHVSVDGNIKVVQHKEGGIVEKILVREGGEVRAGDVLLTLDRTENAARQTIISTQLTGNKIRRMRLSAELQGHSAFSIPTRDMTRETERLYRQELQILQSRQSILNQRQNQLNEQIIGTSQAISGFHAQKRALDRQLVLISQELENLRKLNAQGYAPLTRVNQHERQFEALKGQIGELDASIAQANTQAGSLRMQIQQVVSEMREQTVSELRNLEAEIAQLEQQESTTRDALTRVNLTAPISGTVQGLKVHTEHGVIAPAEVLMTIVPISKSLIVEARIDPRDIDQVKTASTAVIRFSSFSTATTPEARAKVETVSTDVLYDAQTGRPYYLARVQFDRSALKRPLLEKLTAGMPVEVQIQTARRPAATYLIKPLLDQISRAFREE